MGRSSSDFGREHLRSLGRRLRELREARSWSLKRLSAESGVSVAAIQKIESGETNPNLLTVLAIADVLGESVDRLVRVSRRASQISNVVRGTLPALPRGSISLPSLDRPRIKSRLIVLAGGGSLEHAEIPKDGTLFAYVLDGALQLHFSDGTTEQLGTGDSIHVTERMPIEWINPLARRSVTLCLADRRGDSAVF
ncbi:MAG: helix-turn-helix domain-containing protein [Xanthobacteraceae bacterium]